MLRCAEEISVDVARLSRITYSGVWASGSFVSQPATSEEVLQLALQVQREANEEEGKNPLGGKLFLCIRSHSGDRETRDDRASSSGGINNNNNNNRSNIKQAGSR